MFCGRGAAGDLGQVDAPREIRLGQLDQRLPDIGLVGQDDIHGFRGHIEQLGIGNLAGVFAEHLDQHFRPAGYPDYIPRLEDSRRLELDDLAVTAQPFDEDAHALAGGRVQGLGVGHGRARRNLITDLVGANVETAIRGLHATLGRAGRQFLFISFAFGLEIDAQELGAKHGENHAGSDRAPNVSDSIGNGDVIDRLLGLVRRQAKPVDRVGGKTDGRGYGLRAREKAGGEPNVIARDAWRPHRPRQGREPI